jgi:predicted O-linked N-acetylglucosamine transferase (SPINDLY family)
MSSLLKKIKSKTSVLPYLYNALGKIFQQRGNTALALVCFRETIKSNPQDAEAYYAIGKVLLLREDLDNATDAFNQAILLRPDFFEAHNNLGVVYEKRDLLEKAVASYRKALALRPGYAPAYNNIGNIWLADEKLEEAEACYRDALKANPQYVEALNNLSIVLNKKGSFKEAETLCELALQLEPTFAGALNNLGSALQNQGKTEEAIAAYNKGLQLDPSLIEAKINLGLLLGDESRLADALPYYERQLRRNPESFSANNRLAGVMQASGKLVEAKKYYEEAIRLKPDYADAYAGLGMNAASQADLPDALAHFRKALGLAPMPSIQQSLGFHMHHLPAYTPEAIFAVHRGYAEMLGTSISHSSRTFHNFPDPERRIRLGYVSSDFRRHSVSYFMDAIIQGHDRSKVEVFCYANQVNNDQITERFRQASDGWRDVRVKDDDQLYDLIQEDRIDILIDLNGYTAGNRLRAFARKPAPVQVTYVGYPDTTGLSQIDYRLTDIHADPPGMTEAFHSEALVRLPKSFLLYTPSDDAGDVLPSPHLKNAYITFGSFNNATKLNEETVALWSRILQAVPGSRLLLKNFAYSEPSVKERFMAMFARYGVGSEQLSLINYAPTVVSHLALYGEVDIALDTFPYNGTTTTCEALWMGVPVVTIAGKTHVARVGVSLLSNVGLNSHIAGSPDEYVDIAVRLANDKDRLHHLRATLRETMRQSPLMDAPAFLHDLEAAYRDMWRTWCAEQGQIRHAQRSLP